MMRKVNVRSGSALLIVLGMMSFMLFSGLAFSVYMRYARLPTSFLRRTTTTRQLAKAALAEAIEEIDIAIGNNPHPGVNTSDYTSGVVSNVWHHRVFFGVGQSSGGEVDISPTTGMPILTLEGLAYLPPSLINDVRYYSRCTPTANWHPFWFDSGRYAYVAVDVSDYFDVNRALADAPRASSCDRRITLAHLFETVEEGEDGVEHTGPGGGAEAWDSFITGAGVEENPFISIADFNIAWNGNGALTFGGTSVKNPFRNFLDTGYAYGKGVKADSKAAEYYRQLTFVTDSWTPAPVRSDNLEVADLEDTNWQPFNPRELDKDETAKGTLTKIAEESNWKKILKEENYLRKWANTYNAAALWDYLDRDKKPLSLAFPTCEQVPMICAIRPDFAGAFKISKQQTAERKEAGEEGSWVERDYTYSIELKEAGGGLNGTVAWTYPFLLKGRDAKTNGKNDKFACDGRVAIYLTENTVDLTARPGREIEGLFIKDAQDIEKGDVVNSTVLTYPFKVGSATSPKDIHLSDGKTPVQDLPRFTAQSSGNSAAQQARPFVMITYRWKQNKQGVPSEPNFLDPQYIKAVSAPTGDKFGLLKKDGSCDENFDFLKSNGGKKTVQVNAAIWVRVTDADKSTVDLVPACLLDDDNINKGSDDLGTRFGNITAPALLSLKADKTFDISLETLNSESGELGSYEIDDQTLMTGDPRFNHAPENWYVRKEQVANLAQTWYDAEKAVAKGQGDAGEGDIFGDIYMATSDQGYLQGLYELMMLPRIPSNYSTQFDGKVRDTRASLKDSAYMWNTYQPRDFDSVDDGRIVSGDGGQKVNPYSDSTNVLMAAFANTPHNWRVASTNNDETSEMETKEFNRGYAWNSYSTAEDGRLCWGCLSEVAGIFSDWVRSKGEWQAAFREMQWSNSERELLKGIPLDDTDSDLYSVDKKFLYGFWHDSFSARQQLFLIFVRAEPMMMGGGVSGQAPPQLGARAVALVWREPSSFAKSANTKREGTNAAVHRTRVLFYHTFD